MLFKSQNLSNVNQQGVKKRNVIRGITLCGNDFFFALIDYLYFFRYTVTGVINVHNLFFDAVLM